NKAMNYSNDNENHMTSYEQVLDLYKYHFDKARRLQDTLSDYRYGLYGQEIPPQYQVQPSNHQNNLPYGYNIPSKADEFTLPSKENTHNSLNNISPNSRHEEKKLICDEKMKIDEVNVVIQETENKEINQNSQSDNKKESNDTINAKLDNKDKKSISKPKNGSNEKKKKTSNEKLYLHFQNSFPWFSDHITD
ncbi:MAG: hypothetical protein MHPSP_004416, partial [Paramarteilia canceri]